MPPVIRDEIYEDAVGWARITHEAPHLIVTEARGIARVGMVEGYLREVVRACAEATVRIDVFHDWTAITSVDADARALFLRRAEERRAANERVFRGLHVVVTSRLVYVALEVASVLYRRTLRVYRSKGAWDAALGSARASAVREALPAADAAADGSRGAR